MELWRAGRLVVDTGIHHKRWSRADAIGWLAENTPNPPGDIRKAIERYIVYPGQATAYMIGKLKIMELREQARARLGEEFDIREFHDVILANGPVPLSVMEENVAAWVAGPEGRDRWRPIRPNPKPARFRPPFPAGALISSPRRLCLRDRVYTYFVIRTPRDADCGHPAILLGAVPAVCRRQRGDSLRRWWR